MNNQLHELSPNPSDVSSYVSYALSTLSVILLNVPANVGQALSYAVTGLTIIKFLWDFYDKYQAKKARRKAKRKQVAL